MAAIPYPSNLPTFLKAAKSRKQAAVFDLAEPRRGYAHLQETGTDVPVYWDVTFRFGKFQAQQFWLWFVVKLERGKKRFTIPIDTEGGLFTHTCRFMPESLMPAREDAGVWTYTATIEARVIDTGASTSAPTAILLDTFTAANGTDPTSRDMDVHPAGAARWQQFDTESVGVIQSNQFRSSGTSGGYWTNAELLYQLPGEAQIFGPTPFAIVLGGASFTNFIRIYGYNTAGLSEIALAWGSDQISVTAYDETVSLLNLSHPLLQSQRDLHIFAFWTDGTTGKLILDGTEVASASYSLGAMSINWLRLEIFASGTPSTEYDAIDKAGIYQGLTLAEALALTA